MASIFAAILIGVDIAVLSVISLIAVSMVTNVEGIDLHGTDVAAQRPVPPTRHADNIRDRVDLPRQRFSS